MNRKALNRAAQLETTTDTGAHQKILKPTPQDELQDNNILQAYRRTTTYQLDCTPNIIKTPIALTSAQQHYRKRQWRGTLQTTSQCHLGARKRLFYRHHSSILRAPHPVGHQPADTFLHFRAANPYYSQTVQDQLAMGASDMKRKIIETIPDITAKKTCSPVQHSSCGKFE